MKPAVAFGGGQINRILGGQFPRIVKPWQNAIAGPSGAGFDKIIPIIKQAQIPTEFVNQEPHNPIRIGWINHRLGSHNLGNHPAAINVAGQNDGHICGLGKAHIGNVAMTQVDFGGAACAFDDYQIMRCLQPVKAFNDFSDQLGFQGVIIARGGGGHAFALNNDLCADICFGL